MSNWGKHHKGYDFLSGSFQLKDYGCLRNLIAEYHQVNFGQGLVIRQTFNQSKSAMATKSATQINDLHATAQPMSIILCADWLVPGRFEKHSCIFYSNKLQDGNLQDDHLTRFYTTGFHRTALEYTKRNMVRQQVLGGILLFKEHGFRWE